MTNQIIWHQLPNESEEARIDRLNDTLHRIFFDGRDVCIPGAFYYFSDGSVFCHMCEGYAKLEQTFKHSTPRFLESLDAMQLIVGSGKFTQVKERYAPWHAVMKRKVYICDILLNRRGWFHGEGDTRQEAFYVTALQAMGCEVTREKREES